MSLQKKIAWLVEANTKKKPLSIPIKDIHNWQEEYYSDPTNEFNYPGYKKIRASHIAQLRKAIKSGKGVPPVGVTPIVSNKDRKNYKEDHGHYPPKDKKWSLEDGYHRLLAHKLEGKTKIKAYPYEDYLTDYHPSSELLKPTVAEKLSNVPVTNKQISNWQSKIKGS